MPRKAKGKKVKDQSVEEKKKELQKLLECFQAQRREYEAHLNSVCKDTCSKIRKMYEDKLKSLPENIRNMTLSEYMEAKRKAELEESNVTDLQIITSQFAKTKLQSEKKKKIRTERKRSLSASVCSSQKRGLSSNPHQGKLSTKVLSESCLFTPNSKRSMISPHVITPKFNPSMPLSKSCMRKPRAGELVLSISGSPIQNFADDKAISLGGGKVINISEELEMCKGNNDFLKKMDEETLTAIEDVKKKLDKILQNTFPGH